MKKANIKKGDRFSRLTIINEAGRKNERRYFLCKCSCGEVVIVNVSQLLLGKTKSCGCLRVESNYKIRATHGMSRTLSYNINSEKYPRYGGSSIRVDDSWKKFENFFHDMGDKPKGTSLDRIDFNGNYCKENCRWATQKEQQNNRISNRFIVFNGEKKTLSQWSDSTRIKYDCLKARIYNGWNIKRALTTKSLHDI